MVDLYFKHESETYQTSTPDPDDRWDRASTATDWCLTSDVYLTKPDDWGYDNEPVNADLKAGDIIYMVTAIYSTGDSFGHDSRSYADFVGFFKEKHMAYDAVDKITARCNGKYEYDGWKTLDILGSGNNAVIYNFDSTEMRNHECSSYMGYFEHLNEVEVMEVIVHD